MNVLRVIIILVMFIVSIFIVTYYWGTDQFSAIKQVSKYSMILIITYIGLHFIKRLIFKTVQWWDWLYYIGLLSIMSAVLMANSNNENFFHWLVDVSLLTFIIPLVFDVVNFVYSRKAEQ